MRHVLPLLIDVICVWGGGRFCGRECNACPTAHDCGLPPRAPPALGRALMAQRLFVPNGPKTWSHFRTSPSLVGGVAGGRPPPVPAALQRRSYRRRDTGRRVHYMHYTVPERSWNTPTPSAVPPEHVVQKTRHCTPVAPQPVHTTEHEGCVACGQQLQPIFNKRMPECHPRPSPPPATLSPPATPAVLHSQGAV